MNTPNVKSIPTNTLRLVSLFVALVLWVVFSGRTKVVEPVGARVTRVFQVPLVHFGQPSEMEIKSNVFKVFVSLSGTEAEMKSLNGDMLMVKLDLSQYDSGKHQVPIPNESVEVPGEFESVEIEYIEPRAIQYELERKIRKVLKVVVRSKGTPAENYELIDIKVTPSEVTVYGPESEINDLAFLIAEPVDIEGSDSDFNGRIVFNYEKQFPANTTIEQAPSIDYRAIIQEKLQRISLGSFKPMFDGWDPKVKFRPRSVKVTVEGPITVVGKIQKDWIQVVIPEIEDPELPEALPLSFKWIPPLPEEPEQDLPDKAIPAAGDQTPVEPEAKKKKDPILVAIERLSEVVVTLDPSAVEVRKK